MKSSLNLTSYSLEELTDAVRILKNYKTSLHQIGGRAHLEDPKNPRSSELVIQYAPGFTIEVVTSFAKQAVHEYFPEAQFDNTTQFTLNEKITGGIRIFYGDDLMDVSFEKFKNVLTLNK